MARHTTTTHTETTDGGILSRLRRRNHTEKTTTTKTNPITGTRTTKTTTKGHPHRAGAGTGTGSRRTNATARDGAATHHRRKPSVGDKVSGAMMKLKGDITRRPGLKAAGTRRMHGTDGKGSHHTTTV